MTNREEQGQAGPEVLMRGEITELSGIEVDVLYGSVDQFWRNRADKQDDLAFLGTTSGCLITIGRIETSVPVTSGIRNRNRLGKVISYGVEINPESQANTPTKIILTGPFKNMGVVAVVSRREDPLNQTDKSVIVAQNLNQMQSLEAVFAATAYLGKSFQLFAEQVASYQDLSVSSEVVGFEANAVCRTVLGEILAYLQGVPRAVEHSFNYHFKLDNINTDHQEAAEGDWELSWFEIKDLLVSSKAEMGFVGVVEFKYSSARVMFTAKGNLDDQLKICALEYTIVEETGIRRSMELSYVDRYQLNRSLTEQITRHKLSLTRADN